MKLCFQGRIVFGERSLVLRCVSPRLTRCYSRLLLPQIAFSQVSQFTHPPNMRFEDKNSRKRSSASRLEQIIFDTLVSSEKKRQVESLAGCKMGTFFPGLNQEPSLDALSALWCAHLTIDVAVCPPAVNCHQLLRLTRPNRRKRNEKKNCMKGSYQGSNVCHRC